MGVPRFASIIFKRSRRRLTWGILLLILGGIILGYSTPNFIKHARTIGKQSTSISGEWPPEMMVFLEQQRKEAYEDFFRWTFFASAGVLVLLLGLYFGVIKWWKRRAPGA